MVKLTRKRKRKFAKEIFCQNSSTEDESAK